MTTARTIDGQLVIDFRLPFKGRRYRIRESLRLTDTPQNRRTAKEIKLQVESAVALRDLARIAELLPASKKLRELGIVKEKAVAPTLRVYSESWLKEKAIRRKPGTLADYTQTLRFNVWPDPIAQLPIDRVSEQDAEDFIQRLVKKGSPAGTINRVRARLISIYNLAHRRLKISNPFVVTERLEEDEEQKEEIDPFSIEEVSAIVRAAKGWERVFAIVAFGTGLRPGELFGLKWEDIDFGADLIHVRRTIGQHGVGRPKTRKSQRSVDMTASVRAALTEQQTRSGILQIVFPSAARGYIQEHNFNARNWTRLQRAAAVRRRPVGQTRHTFAVLLLSDRETDLRYIADQMGHRNLQMIIKHYARWIQGHLPKPKRDHLAAAVRKLA